MTDEQGTRASDRSRRRGAELVSAIHRSVIEEALQAGVNGLTMEGIAKRAATAKTVLYRRWSSPQEILLDALHATYPRETPAPEADDLRGDLLRSLRQMADWMGQPTGRVIGEVMLERHRHPELVESLYKRVFDARGGRFTLTVMRHYAERGVVDPARVTPVVADIGEALLIKYMTDNGRLPDDEWIAAVVDQAILPALGVAPERAARSSA
ncbi:TetR/AcrR family transcriptional regulator C-terminal ligand-binding domain-containing protein [Thermobifida halotolerans]|uniref:TetR/AcrR family transcriptional regulator C-terminal ligand-binding domain-containing protein n=1 Tax=Thermobifida halotolerans TaxID=483545 RepID=A0A399FYL1_9ACTN|nr:TetR/AcrR family transcriptional regulator [Thermobifida halotolerans]UOE18790.1 TetR/AcrR family transcriptional regulator C-terminal ligand-binding domain-containing protein [Thermobifida halotolerans]